MQSACVTKLQGMTTCPAAQRDKFLISVSLSSSQSQTKHYRCNIVAPQILALALKMKGADALALISDSVAPTGLGDGDFSLWGENIAIKGRTTKNDRGSIAGSVITMADAVRTYRSLGTPWEVIAKIASSTPASILGLDDRGVIAEGKRADLVAMDADGRVTFVSVGGKVRVKVSR